MGWGELNWGELNPKFRVALIKFLGANGGKAPIEAVRRVLANEGLVYVSPFDIIQLAEQDDLVVYDRNLQIVILRKFFINDE